MLEWNPGDAPENAALQFLNILFSVPQISVRFADLPESHRRMLHFWLHFWMEHRDTLLKGSLKPYHPELNYPLVSAENSLEKVIAVYHSGQVAEIECAPGKVCFVVNATGSTGVICNLKNKPRAAEFFDTTGFPAAGTLPEPGYGCISIPSSGLLKLQF